MARKKVKNELVLDSWDDVQFALKEVGEFELQIDEINIIMQRQLDEAKDEAATLMKPLQEQIKEIGRDIHDFVEKNRSDLNGKSKQLAFGRVGYRLSTKVVTPKVADIISNLKHYGMDDCIIVKESISKNALGAYPSEDVLKTGAYLKSTDDFWYEVDKDTLKPVE